MNDPTDPSLRALFRAAADHGSREATTLPVAQVVERGRRAHRRRLALATVTAGVVAVLGVATAASLAPGPADPVLPATSPSVPPPGPSPTHRPEPLPQGTENSTPPGPGSATTESLRTRPPTTSSRTTTPMTPPETATTMATTTPPRG
ncbi:hypothetical protein [Streptomyces sp. NPDC086147]|uniref:hypothetical protein n=1 Tax=unclassified Streptomyces TaxID=2593676 RepID=UPI00344DF497